MPEHKKRIVIASVLKPLNDTRMTEKMATTLAEDPLHEVHVIGFPSAMPADARITYHTFPAFKRLSLARVLTPLRILRSLVRIKPAIVIVTTHELLAAAVITKMLLGTRVVYDVQENYYLNIKHTIAFPALLRAPIATYVRCKERMASVFVDRFILAEGVYAQQLGFVKDRFTLVLNKARRPGLETAQRLPMQLVFTGTLSRSTGVFRAIELAKKFHANDPKVKLQILGYAAIEAERNELFKVVRSCQFLELVGGDKLVNHEIIVDAISRAGAGVIAYSPNPATAGRIPTKLYEYIGSGLPLIFIDSDPAWLELARHHNAKFVALRLDHLATFDLIGWLRQPTPRGTSLDSLYWENEQISLKTALSGL